MSFSAARHGFALAVGVAGLSLLGPAAAAFGFVDATESAGIDFTHTGGGEAPWFPEMMGSGACWLDADGDGYDDLWILNGAYKDPSLQRERRPHGAFYRNNGDGTFTDETAVSGLSFEGYGNGCSVSDYDGDGCVDAYAGGYDVSYLFRSNCDGTFRNVTLEAGILNDVCPNPNCWAHSSAWADYDGDGDLDLFVGNYVDMLTAPFQLNGPGIYKGQPDALYRNNGDGTFTDVGVSAGVAGEYSYNASKTLAVGWQDFDLDGDPDLYVANDESPQNLFRNNGDGTFTDVAPDLGVNWDRAGMGVAWGDVDRNGCPEVAVTFFASQREGFGWNRCGGDLRDESGEEFPHNLDDHLEYVRWANVFWDYDNDGWLDYVVVSGYVYYGERDPINQQTVVYRNVLGDDGANTTFRNATADLGVALRDGRLNGRGAAFGDYDHDGLLDFIVIPNYGQKAWLLRGSDGGENRWIDLQLRQPGTRNVFAIGALVSVTAGGATLTQELVAGSGFESTNSFNLHFGLGSAESVERVRVRWPDGTAEEWTDLAPNGLYRLVRGDPVARDEVISPRTTLGADVEPLGTGWYPAPVRVTLAAVDRGVQRVSGVSGTEYSLDGGPFVPYEGTLEFPVEGAHELRWRSSDVAGNVEPLRRARVDVDLEDPRTTHSLDREAVAGWLPSDTTLTLDGTDSFSGIATTYHRFSPSEAFVEYAEPVRLPTGEHTLEYYSVDVAGREEPRRLAQLRVDASAPTTEAALAGPAGDAGWWRGDVTVTLSASDAQSGVVETTVGLDGGNDGPYAGPLVVRGDGLHTLRFHSRDAVGNEETQRAVLIRIDGAPPSSSDSIETAPGANGWLRSAVLTMSGSDEGSGLGSLRYRTDGVTWSSLDGPAALPDGRLALETSARDVAGNEEAPRLQRLDVDGAPPATDVALEGPAGHAGWWRGSVRVRLDPADAVSGVEGSEAGLDGADLAAVSGPVEVAGDGVHELRYRSRDFAGNVEPARRTEIPIDATPPSTTGELTGPRGRAGWWLGPVGARLEATDATSGVAQTRFDLDGAGATPYDGPVVVSGDGVHELLYLSEDVAGNAEPGNLLRLSIDSEPPATAWTASGPEGLAGWWRGPVRLAFTASDATSGVAQTFVSLRSGEWVGSSDPLEEVEGDGVHAFAYFSEDVAGNRETAREGDVRIDATPPVTRGDLSGEAGLGGWWRGNVTATFEASDATSGVAAVFAGVDGAAPAPTPGPVLLEGEGRHSLGFFARDVAGNAEAERAVEVRIDWTPPETRPGVEGVEGAAGWHVSPVRVRLHAVDDGSGVADLLAELNGVPVGAELELTDGVHLLRWRAEDVAGNVEALRERMLAVDTRPPETRLGVERGASALVGERLHVTPETRLVLEAEDALSGVAGLRYRVDGGGFRDGIEAFTLEGPDGERVVEFYALDVAGNEEPLRAVRVVVDSTSPRAHVEYAAPAALPASVWATAEPARATWGAPLLVGDRLRVLVHAMDDGVGVGSVRILVDGELRAAFDGEGPHTWSWEAGAAEAGVRVVRVEAADLLGNSHVSEREVLVVPLPLSAIGSRVAWGGG